MSTYRNTADRRNLTIHPDGVLIIATDDMPDDLAFTPRTDDRPAIALDVLGEVENPDNHWVRRPEALADDYSEEELATCASRWLKALAIWRERATKAEAEAKEAEAQLDREALTKEGRTLRRAFYASEGGDIEDNWAGVARKARELHAEAGK